jgi:hypothetical protein
MRKLLLALGLLATTGCGLLAHDLGVAGRNPGYISCKGKVSLVGTGSLSLGAGVGGSGTDSFAISGDCGDGFSMSSGQPASSLPKAQ